jgi:hypothetical protein
MTCMKNRTITYVVYTLKDTPVLYACMYVHKKTHIDTKTMRDQSTRAHKTHMYVHMYLNIVYANRSNFMSVKTLCQNVCKVRYIVMLRCKEKVSLNTFKHAYTCKYRERLFATHSKQDIYIYILTYIYIYMYIYIYIYIYIFKIY